MCYTVFLAFCTGRPDLFSTMVSTYAQVQAGVQVQGNRWGLVFSD